MWDEWQTAVTIEPLWLIFKVHSELWLDMTFQYALICLPNLKGHISPVSDTGKNLRNLQCLALECECSLLPGERMEKWSVADRHKWGWDGGVGRHNQWRLLYLEKSGKPQMGLIYHKFVIYTSNPDKMTRLLWGKVLVSSVPLHYAILWPSTSAEKARKDLDPSLKN